MTLQTSEGSTESTMSGNEGGSFASFDDLGDDTFQEPSDEKDAFDFDESEDDGDDSVPLFKRQKSKEEEKKKAKGQKGDDLKALEVAEGVENKEESEEEAEEESEEAEEETEEKKPKETEESAEKPKDEKAPKGKKLYMKIGDETFAVDSNALIPHKVDGKPVHVPIQELLNNYSGKVAWDQRMNEVNVKNIEYQKKEQAFAQNREKVSTFVKDIISIVENPEADPDDILEKIADYYENSIDGKEIDLYALKERSFKSKLAELAKVLNFETDAERKAYFLEKRNENLSKQTEKRKQKQEASQRVTSYKQQADALRKSYGVSEAQYVDALEELRSFGYEDKDISEKQIVEWASITPHKPKIVELLNPYRDQISEESYGEIVWTLSHLLRKGEASLDQIKNDISEIYGLPTEVKEISEKLSPVGRKKTPPASPKKSGYDSFDDIDED